jgi:hypothetical protein
MIIILSYRKIKIFLSVFAFIILCGSIMAFVTVSRGTTANSVSTEAFEFISRLMQQVIEERDAAVLSGDVKTLEHFYSMQIRNSRWAYEYEARKSSFMQKWGDRQNASFVSVKSDVILKSARHKGEGFAMVLLVSTEYVYSYLDTPDTLNSFRSGSYHYADIIPQGEAWVITKEWYADPVADFWHSSQEFEESVKKITAEGQERDLSDLNTRRLDAVKYADMYCGTASLPEFGFKYNPKYRDFNPEGGDCANYASQMLYEGGKFRKTGSWNYANGSGSRAWLNASGFHYFMTNSGRASLISHGSYEKVLKSSYKLLPGDYIAYEKKGKIVHISVVTGLDSKGYPLVNSHNADRYRMPWDMGWNSKGITFRLVRVHY